MEAHPLARPFLLAFLLSALSCGAAEATEPARAPSKVSLGLAIGLPQLLGPTIEIRSDRPLRVQASGSVLFLVNSATARLVLGEPTVGTRPYGFAGGGVYDIEEGDSPDDAHGATGFLWFGGGLRIKLGGRVGLFGEIGSMMGLDTSKHYQSSYATAAAGFLVGL